MTTNWLHEMLARGRTKWPLKIGGISAGIALFMVAYFLLLNHPLFPVREVPLQGLDHWITFTPWALLPYASLWIYIAMVPGFLYPGAEVKVYLRSVIMVSVLGLGVFLLWPTAIPDRAINWEHYPMVMWLKTTDAAGNACPSMHVAFAVLTCLWLIQLLQRIQAPRHLHVVNIIWCMAIIWSTLALKQHVALDVETGAVLGAAVVGLHHHKWLLTA